MREKSAAAKPVRACGAHRQFIPIQRLDDLGGEQRLQLLNIGVLPAQSRNTLPLPRTSCSLPVFMGVPPLTSSNDR
jgi:hypothetical protein